MKVYFAPVTATVKAMMTNAILGTSGGGGDSQNFGDIPTSGDSGEF